MEKQKTDFDAIIVGSGFGGSVMTHNLARAGLKVCLLERGKEYAPGAFPRTPDQFKDAFWDPSSKQLGLFNFWSFRDLDCIVSSGLGGGSLIYANVMLEKDEEWFDMIKPKGEDETLLDRFKYFVCNWLNLEQKKGDYESWPISFQDLKPHYNNVKKILDPVTYPKDHALTTPKTVALKEAAEKLNLEVIDVPLAITFTSDKNKPPIPGEQLPPDLNIHGADRYACRLCGECYLGCNYGSKNTLDMNFLGIAKHKFANEVDIRTLKEVTRFKKIGDQYHVWYRDHDDKTNQGNSAEQTKPITCKYLILCAGTLGSTFLMLKNQLNLETKENKLSKMLGKNFSGNGDLLKVANNCRDEKNGKLVPRDLKPFYGPVITRAAKSDSKTDKDARFYIEDWAYSSTMIWLFEVVNPNRFLCRWGKLIGSYVGTVFNISPNPNLGTDVSRFFAESNTSSSSFTMVGMGMDRSNGTMSLSLDKRFLRLWSARSNSHRYYRNVRRAMDSIANKLGAKGKASDFPSWDLGKTITVHPLGGCPMGKTAKTGVVNEFGEVHGFGNLFIADGSVLPAAVGPNPSLTIAALSDRFSLHIAERYKNGKSKQNTPANPTEQTQA